MRRFLMSLFVSLCGRPKRKPAARRERRARLHVETMEERLSPTGALAGLAAGLAPVVAAPAPATPGTGVVLPDQVCGYKHRGPCRPHALVTGKTTGTQAQPGAVVLATVAAASTSAHLVGGAADGVTVTVASGHVTVTPSQGPLAGALPAF
jgi:hypothetical protein